MDKKSQEKVQETFDFIQKDRVIPDDPWFYSRLIARMEKEAENAPQWGLVGSVILRLRPVLAVMVVLIGIAGGVVLGRFLSIPVDSLESTTAVLLPEEDANAIIFREISSAMDEQILLIK